MQLVHQYLYDSITEINLHDGTSTRTWNGNMYNRQLKLYKGIDNAFRFVIKNQDNKPVNILSKTVTFILMDRADNVSLLQLDGTIIDGVKGIAEVKILDTSLLDIAARFYNFAVKVTDAEGVVLPVYTDLAFNINGSVEVLDHIYPTFVASQSSFISSFVRNSEILPDSTTVIRHISDTFNAKSSLHAIQVYFTNFTGILTIQGTMAQVATIDENDWSDIIAIEESDKDITFSNQSANKAYTFSGNFTKIRVKFRFTTGLLGDPSGPLVGPLGQDGGVQGKTGAGIIAGNFSGNASGTNTGPVFVIGESFWVDETLVTMTGITATTFAADVNALDLENLSVSVEPDGSVQFNYTGGTSYDLSYSGVDKILYRS